MRPDEAVLVDGANEIHAAEQRVALRLGLRARLEHHGVGGRILEPLLLAGGERGDALFLIEIGAADGDERERHAADGGEEPRIFDLLDKAGEERAQIDLPRAAAAAAAAAARLFLARTTGQKIDLDHESYPLFEMARVDIKRLFATRGRWGASAAERSRQ